MRNRSFVMLAALLVLGAAALSTLRADDPPKNGGSVSGIVVDKDSKRAPSTVITVLLAPNADHTQDPKPVKTATCNDDGTFKIVLEPGHYTFKYAMGSEQAVSTNVIVQADKDTPLGKITLRVVTPPKPPRL